MTGANWLPALLMIATAFALAIAPARFRWPALLAFLAIGVAAAFFTYPEWWNQAMLAGAWLSVIATALAVYRKPDVALATPLVLAINAGFWLGAVTTTIDNDWALVRIMPLVLIVVPAGWLVARRASIVLKFLASWLVAIAILIMALPMVITPGYVEDHME